MTMLMKAPKKGLQRFEPFHEMEEMRREMDDIFAWFGRRMPRFAPAGREAWMPFVDVFEKNGEIVVKAELPGLEKKDIKVHVTDDVLTIEGERKTEEKVEEDNWFRHEMSYGEFVRRIDLPEGVDPERIEARYENGILELHMPKSEGFKPKEIPIPVK